VINGINTEFTFAITFCSLSYSQFLLTTGNTSSARARAPRDRVGNRVAPHRDAALAARVAGDVARDLRLV
jgi:hypothetical protein